MAIWDRILHSNESHERRAHELWERALRYFDGKLYNRALKDLSEAIELQPAYGSEAMELMQTFSSQGNDEQALSVGLALLKVDPDNADLVNRLGNIVRRMGSFSRAQKLYTRALKINPKYTEAKYNLAACSFGVVTADGELLRQTRQVEGFTEPRRFGFLPPREDFVPIPNQVLEDGQVTIPEEAQPAEGEGEEQDEETRAQQEQMMARQLQEDIGADGDAWEPEFNLGLYYDLIGMGELAVQHLERARSMAPEEDVRTENNLAVAVMLHKGDNYTAEGLLLEALEHSRFERTVVQNLAVLYRRQGKGFQTLKYYVYLGDLLAKSLGEFDLEKAKGHAEELFGRRKYIEAIPFFENIARETEEPHWYEKLAVMYYNQKKEDKYVQALKDLLRVDPSNTSAREKLTETAARYETQARERAEKGDKRRAAPLMEKAVKIEETAERWVELAQLYEDIGEEVLATNALKKWKRLTGGDKPAEAKQEARAR